MTYRDFYRKSIDEPEPFWAGEAKRVHWHRPFDKVLDYSKPPFARWFVGGMTNLCHNAIDRHLATRASQPALVWISTEVDQQRVFTYAELADEVNRCAAIVRSLGVGEGDRVLIYMPMVPEAVFAMLATVRIGAIHSVVFGGFAPASLPPRIDGAHLLLEARGRVFLDVGHRLGGGPLVHRVRAAHQRLDHDHVRGRADAPRCRNLVEDRAGLEGDVDVHVAHRDPRAEEARYVVHEEVRHPQAQVPVPRRRAPRRADGALGGGGAGAYGHRRQLLADRDRLADPHRVPGSRGHAAQVWLALVRGVRLPDQAQARGNGQGSRRRREGRALRGPPAASGRDDHGVGRRQALRRDLLQVLQGRDDLYDVRLGDARQGWLLFRPGPHRRRHQRRRPSHRHARDRGGGAGALERRRSGGGGGGPVAPRTGGPWPSPGGRHHEGPGPRARRLAPERE